MVETTSTELWEEGIALYNKGKPLEAIDKFKQGAILDPKDPALARGISGALFEVGKYDACIEATRKALELETNKEKIRMLQQREKMCEFHRRNWPGLLDHSASATDQGSDERRILLAANHYQEAENSNTLGWADVIGAYRSRPRPGPFEYYSNGNEQPSEVFSDKDLLQRKTTNGKIDLALLYGDVGDGRHLIQQLNHIYSYRKMLQKTESGASQKNVKDQFELVIQDSDENAIARLLILFRLLNEAVQLHRTSNSKKKKVDLQEIEVVMTYLFAGPIIPGWVHDKICATMSSLLEDAIVEDGKCNFEIPWLEVPSASVKAIRLVFRRWLSYSEGTVAVEGVAALQKEPCSVAFADEIIKVVGRHAEPLILFTETYMIVPPFDLYRRKEPGLAKILDQKGLSRQKIDDLKQYTRKHWKRNITQIQGDEWFTWFTGLPNPNIWPSLSTHFSEYYHCILEKIPENTFQELVSELISSRVSQYVEREERHPQPIDIFGIWFSAAARSFTDIGAQIKVHLESGDIIRQMDIYKFGSPEQQKRFDSITLSNIPDFTGGQLSIILHALPILKDKGSHAQSKILFNPRRFHLGISHTIAEYLCLPDLQTATKLLGLSLEKKDSIQKVQRQHKMPGYWPLTQYQRWENPINNPFQLPNKTWFLRWLAQFFLKACLPVERKYRGLKPVGFNSIEQPQTLYSFLRLCTFLIERGIPSHWISSLFLDPILSTGTLKAAVPPPCTAPINPFQTMNPYWPNAFPATDPVRKYDITPFLPELVPLLTLFQNVLPISLIKIHLIPAPSSLRRCTLKAENTAKPDVMPSWPQLLSLIVFKTEACGKLLGMNIVTVMKPGWLRERLILGAGGNGMMIGGFKWTHVESEWKGAILVKRGVAEWIMSVDDQERMERERWSVAVVKTDDYTLVSEVHAFSEVEVEVFGDA